MDEDKKPTFGDIVEPMKQYIKGLIIKTIVFTLLVAGIFAALKMYKYILLAVAAGALYSVYIIYLINRSLKGKGCKYEGVIKDSTTDIPLTKGKRLLSVLQRKPLSPKIVFTTDDGYDIQMTLKQQNTFEIGNRIAVYTSEKSIRRKSTDRYILDGYYCIELLLSDNNNRGRFDENEEVWPEAESWNSDYEDEEETDDEYEVTEENTASLKDDEA